jgi:hypothetical protein
MALGDLAFEETGKFAGIRALPDGKVEATYQGTGKLFVQTIHLSIQASQLRMEEP